MDNWDKHLNDPCQQVITFEDLLEIADADIEGDWGHEADHYLFTINDYHEGGWSSHEHDYIPERLVEEGVLERVEGELRDTLTGVTEKQAHSLNPETDDLGDLIDPRDIAIQFGQQLDRHFRSNEDTQHGLYESFIADLRRRAGIA